MKAKDEPQIKVGKAEDVFKRQGQLQTGSWREILLVHVLVGYTELEAALHRKLRRQRIRGEWFESSPETREFLAFVEDLGERMLIHAETTGKLPNWREFAEWEPPKEKRKAASLRTSFVAPQPLSAEEVSMRFYEREKERGRGIVREEPEIGWASLCPKCNEEMYSRSEPDRTHPRWHPGTALCPSGHCWLYTRSTAKTSKRPPKFHIVSPA